MSRLRRRCRARLRSYFRASQVAMLLKRYANCIDGQELAANDRIAQALEDGGV